jgi:acid phosphatase (class A)
VGSAEDRRDLERLRTLQSSRTDAQCDLGTRQRIPTYDVLFARSGLLNAEQVQLARALTERVMERTEEVTSHFKKKFARERPYNRDAALVPCIDPPSGKTSYPSSHASMGVAGACVLSDLFPAKKAQLEAQGLAIGETRVTIGVHHPSDVRAGQAIGEQVCELIRKDASYKSEVRAVRGH